MKYRNILITGGAGFVGSNLAVYLKKNYTNTNILALDNLSRRGSELNISRLKKAGIKFIWGDVRYKKDLDLKTDLIIECSAEPSVMAGVNSSPDYLVKTNLFGLFNCLEIARKNKADIIFLSTSRVYPVSQLNNLEYETHKSRFVWKKQKEQGFSKSGINEQFPMGKVRTLYGASKLASEFLIMEYLENYGIKGIVNRCGLISGPYQMGKIDQGIIMLWVASHFYKKKLSYIGFNGEGKQVRDVLHIDDLCDLLYYQINNLDKLSGEVFNVGGGLRNSVSLLELTSLCEDLTGNKIPISRIKSTRAGDVRIFITDNSKITIATQWEPKRSVQQTVSDIYKWILENQDSIKNIF